MHLHADAFQDVDSTGFHGSRAADPIGRICSPVSQCGLKIQPWSMRRNSPTLLPCSGFTRRCCPLRLREEAGFQTMGRTMGKATPWSCYSLIPPGERLAWHFKAGARQNTCGDESTSRGCASPGACPAPALKPGLAQEPRQELRRMGLMVLTSPELCSNPATLGIQGNRGASTTRGHKGAPRASVLCWAVVTSTME